MSDEKSTRTQPHPTIKVTDFGPIAQGQVELRPLTVFAGPSNTGKSWLATLIYALSDLASIGPFAVAELVEETFLDNAGTNRRRFPEDPRAWIKYIEQGSPIRLTEGDRQFVKDLLEKHVGEHGHEIGRCFGIQRSAHLVREAAADKTATIEVRSATDTVFTLKVQEEISLAVQPPWILPVSSPPHESDEMTTVLRSLQEAVQERADETELSPIRHLHFPIFSLALHAVSNLLSGGGPFTSASSAWYLPADRGGVMHAHRTLVGALIQGASRAGLRPPPVPILSGILSDFLNKLVQLEPATRHQPGMDHDLASNLEKNVLGGAVEIETNEANYPGFFWRPEGWDRQLSVLNASSMVSELAPVALYLRHYVSPGDLLILEEPEAHLHPSKQVELIREVSAWVRAGLRVILTTHSEWVLEELANLVAAGKAGGPDGLKQDQIGLWLFEAPDAASGSHIREIKWDEGEGGFVTGFEDVAAAQHNRWADLIGGME